MVNSLSVPSFLFPSNENLSNVLQTLRLDSEDTDIKTQVMTFQNS